MSEQPTPTPDEQEATILVGGITREEFLGEPERIDFLQPPRPVRPPSNDDAPPEAEQLPEDEEQPSSD